MGLFIFKVGCLLKGQCIRGLVREYFLLMNYHKELNRQEIGTEPLWKKIGRVMESKNRDLCPDPEMATSIEQQLSKTEQNMSKSRTLITQDYMNNTSLAESGFIEIKQQKSKSISQSEQMEPESEHPKVSLYKKCKNYHILHKFIKLTMQIQELKYKYEKFAINLFRKLEEFFLSIYETVTKEMQSNKISKIYTQELEKQNKQLKKQLTQLARVFEEKTQIIYSLQKELKETKSVLEVYQGNQGSGIGQKYAPEKQYLNGRNRVQMVKSQFEKDSEKIIRSSLNGFEPLNLTSVRYADRKEIGTKRQKYTTNQPYKALTSQRQTAHKSKTSQNINGECNDFIALQRKLKSLKSQIERIT